MDLGALLHGTNPLFFDVALLIGRVSIGICFMIHAFGKLGWIGSGTMDGFASWLADLGVPMPGVLKPHRDDCRIRPEAAYRVSLTAQKYEQLLRAAALSSPDSQFGIEPQQPVIKTDPVFSDSYSSSVAGLHRSPSHATTL